MTRPEFKTEQEQFWAGSFGDEYVNRNQGPNAIASNCAFFSRILARTNGVNSVIEFGANIGLNLSAIRTLRPDIGLSAVEINPTAIEQLQKIDAIEIFPGSLLEFQPSRTWDFVLIKGVLIHINPDHLAQLYDLLARSSQKYVCIAEYYNPTPVSIPYRGHADRLFKRDFAGEFLDRFNSFALIDYGFVYHRDPNFPADDITWFLLER